LPSGDPAGGLKMRNDLADPKYVPIDIRNPSARPKGLTLSQ